LGNDQLVRTILRNLITNAIKFTPEKGEVAVSYEYLPDHYQVCIADSGIGIPPERLQTLLNFKKPFHTLGTKKESGSGLGLSLCHEFVNKMGGKLWIISDVGVGTTIFFNLPYSPATPGFADSSE
jgi:signal transduction histidine kinase